MKLLLSLSLVSSLFLVGCSSTINKSQHASNLDIKTQSELTTDIEVDMNKVLKGTARQKTILGFIDIESSNHFVDGVSYNGGDSGFSLFSGGIVESTKAAAAYVAVTKGNADVIVAPKYVVKVESKFLGAYKEVTATVTGYAGRIKSIRSTNKR